MRRSNFALRVPIVRGILARANLPGVTLICRLIDANRTRAEVEIIDPQRE